MGKRTNWDKHARFWRNPAEAVSLWQLGSSLRRELFESRTHGDFWGILGDLGITLLISREYEHFLLALTVRKGRPFPTYMPLPHPSGIAIDRKRDRVFVASTRNPNQLFSFERISNLIERADSSKFELDEFPLIPRRSLFLPGSLYIHDLAMIDGELYANAAGHNAIIRIGEHGYARAWWPKCIERRGIPDWSRNYIQLNSIAAGHTLRESYFSASGESIGFRCPGQRNYPVDGRGVIFSGKTREPIVSGLTRPHSARLWRKRLWVDNSGYGEFGVVEDGIFVSVARLPGWTRGLAFRSGYVFVGVSRVIPRFRAYAPGLDVRASVCGIFVVEIKSGNVVASLIWPNGSQIFAVDWISAERTFGFPFSGSGRHSRARLEHLFYSFR